MVNLVAFPFLTNVLNISALFSLSLNFALQVSSVIFSCQFTSIFLFFAYYSFNILHIFTDYNLVYILPMFSIAFLLVRRLLFNLFAIFNIMFPSHNKFIIYCFYFNIIFLLLFITIYINRKLYLIIINLK